MSFGALRVLNDDVLTGGSGFGTHPHDNMEIVSIPLSGSLRHEDSLGNHNVVSVGSVQVISAGTGLFHSEYNGSPTQPAAFLQLWIYPDVLNTTPGYTAITLPRTFRENHLYPFIQPGNGAATVTIRQDTWMSMGFFDNASVTEYQMHKEDNGVYAFVIGGAFDIDGRVLQNRDGLGIYNGEGVTIRSLSDQAGLLLIEVPMSLPFAV